MQYNLICPGDYSPDYYIFSGTEEELRDYIRKNVTEYTYKIIPEIGKDYVGKRIDGCRIEDLIVTIDGPEVSSYLE